MSKTKYTILFNNVDATDEQLERIKEITVEQEIDKAWEARITIPISMDDNGKWTAEDEEFMKPYSQVRVEVKTKKDYVPLIDGPIVGFESPMNPEPGNSLITLIVHDNSALMNRKDRIVKIDKDKKYNTIVKQIFQESGNIKFFDIDKDNLSHSSTQELIFRGTDIQILRSLAKMYGMHVYVLPSENPGEGIGCFKLFPVNKETTLDPLILTGENRTISEFNISNYADRPSIFNSFFLDMHDKSIKQSRASFHDSEIMGSEHVLAGNPDDTLQIIRNNLTFPENFERILKTSAADSGYSIEATGKVNNCYQDILIPYQLVTIMGINGRLSGDFLISQVTHNLTLSTYSQSFKVLRNARSSGSSNTISSNDVGGIF